MRLDRREGERRNDAVKRLRRVLKKGMLLLVDTEVGHGVNYGKVLVQASHDWKLWCCILATDSAHYKPWIRRDIFYFSLASFVDGPRLHWKLTEIPWEDLPLYVGMPHQSKLFKEILANGVSHG